MTRAEFSREGSSAPAHWRRPIWRDPRALREVERAFVIDHLRRSARAAVLEAMQCAGLWRSVRTGPRRFGVGQRALQVASALVEIVPDEHARLLRANALMAAQRASEAAEEFVRLERECGDRRMRGHATTGLAIAAAMAGDRALGLARCRAALASPFEDISISGALSLVVQAARARIGKTTLFMRSMRSSSGSRCKERRSSRGSSATTPLAAIAAALGRFSAH